MYYAEGPGLYTDQLNPFETNGLNWPYLVSKGFEWATFQVYNPQLDPDYYDYPLDQVKAHGFKNVGVWGVIYDQSNFYEGGKATAQQAIKMSADHLIINAEQCMKDTRVGSLARPIIQGCRDGGWTGAVDLVTLGSPSDPLKFDYAMDVGSFISTGGSIQAEDYFNESFDYLPKNVATYWNRMGVPAGKINHSIALYKGAKGRIPGTQWVMLLTAAGVKRNFSVYMTQHGMKEDYDVLEALIKSTAPQPPVSANTATKAGMIKLADEWLNTQTTPQTLSRIKMAKRILETTDSQWPLIREKILTLLG